MPSVAVACVDSILPVGAAILPVVLPGVDAIVDPVGGIVAAVDANIVAGRRT